MPREKATWLASTGLLVRPGGGLTDSPWDLPAFYASFLFLIPAFKLPASFVVTAPPTAALPINMPSKAPASASLFPVSRVAGSPPEISDSSTTAGSRTSGYSLGPSSYAGSLSGDYESSTTSYSGVDVVDMLSDRMNNAFDPTPLDKGLAKQAQASGQLNAKQRELLELQALAQRRLKGVRANFAEGIKTAKETKRDLEWTQKRVSALKSKAESAHPDEYRRATRTYTYDDEY
ncbi:hypothetical protein DTO271G3_7604 [Paecilomyces variotii]|nr:hypothetical protein DTO271G3_7604 [Paecilomyces variotii]